MSVITNEVVTFLNDDDDEHDEFQFHGWCLFVCPALPECVFLFCVECLEENKIEHEFSSFYFLSFRKLCIIR